MIEPFVSICCLTYNHTQFIRQCIDGFMTQETNFFFEIIIHDDASTDDTANIIREYEQKFPNIVKPIYQRINQCSKGAKYFANYLSQNFYSKARGKYIAFCEGDDYWTDPYKLQKQVEFLEKNTDYSFCFCRFKTLVHDSEILQNDNNESLFMDGADCVDFDFERFYLGWHVGTQTIVFRTDLFNQINIIKYDYFRDVHLFVELLFLGKGTCLNFFGAVYRKHAGGVYSGADNFTNSLNGYLIYKEIFNQNKKELFLKLKYLKFTNGYFNMLIINKQYYTAIKIAFEMFFLDKKVFLLLHKLLKLLVKTFTIKSK